MFNSCLRLLLSSQSHSGFEGNFFELVSSIMKESIVGSIVGLIRWFEYGTFCPIFRVHGYKSNAELWNYGPQVEHILTQYDALRYRLLPYIYSAAWGVTKNGETLMRALP